MRGKTNNDALDPLYQLFEHFLFKRSYDDSKKFTHELATEYVAYLDSTPAHVPFHLRTGVIEDLQLEIHEMLVKKMYGCVKASDYTNSGKVTMLSHKKAIEKVDYFPPDDPQGTSRDSAE